MAHIQAKTAFGQIRRTPFQAIAAVFVLSLTFFITTVLAVLVYASDQTLKHFETRPQIIAFIKEDATDADISSLKTKLESDDRVHDVVYKTKEEALEIYKEATSDNPLLTELVDPSIFPASLEFSLSDLQYAEDVVAEMKSEPVIEQVGYTASLGDEDNLDEVVQRLARFTSYVRVGGAIFVALLMSTSFLVLLVIISLRMAGKRGEIEILKLIGASGAFIRNPIILEALIYSILGVFCGWVLALLLVLYATPNILSYFGSIPVLPRDTVDLLSKFGILLGAELGIGIVLAFFGSVFAVSRARKKS